MMMPTCLLIYITMVAAGMAMPTTDGGSQANGTLSKRTRRPRCSADQICGKEKDSELVPGKRIWEIYCKCSESTTCPLLVSDSGFPIQSSDNEELFVCGRVSYYPACPEPHGNPVINWRMQCRCNQYRWRNGQIECY
uniref:Gsp_09 putative toxin n=1 Tax=Gemmula speciosa TaxID=439592 RepID=A0A098LXU6_GEMSP